MFSYYSNINISSSSKSINISKVKEIHSYVLCNNTIRIQKVE